MMNKNGLLYDFTKNWKAYMFMLPVLLGVLIFSVYPIISSLFFSFTDYNLAYPPYNFGLQNYIKMFTTDWDKVGKALGITGLYTVITVPSMLILSFLLALFLSKARKGIGVIRTLFYIPVVIPAIVVSLLWVDILSPDSGIANTLLQALGLPTSRFLQSAESALPTVMVLNVWNIGGSLILWLSALKNVPAELKESAELDGAGRWKVLRHVVIPMCTPIIFYSLITSVIASLQSFGSYFMVKGGGTDDSLLFFSVKIYLEGFYSKRFGYASALSWLLFFIVGGLTLVMFKTGRWVHYEE